MILDIVHHDWTEYSLLLFMCSAILGGLTITVTGIISLFRNSHDTPTTSFMSVGAVGIVLSMVMGFTMAAPQQNTVLEIDNTLYTYTGSERDLMNDIIEPKTAHTTTFITDRQWYEYKGCELLSEPVSDDTARFTVECESPDGERITFDDAQ